MHASCRRSSRPKRSIPAREVDLGSFLVDLHRQGCPAILIKIVYYVLIASPVRMEELVDSLEVFSGLANYSKVTMGSYT